MQHNITNEISYAFPEDFILILNTRRQLNAIRQRDASALTTSQNVRSLRHKNSSILFA